LGDIQIVNASIKSGSLQIEARNDISEPVDIYYQLPYATLNGIPFDTLITLPAAIDATTGSTTSVTINLAGYAIDFRGINANSYNTIVSQSTIQFNSSVTGLTLITPADSVSLFVTLVDLVPQYAKGYFGNPTLNIGPEESFTDVFAQIAGGSFGLEALKLELEIENYIGVDGRMQINRFWSRNSGTGQIVDLTAPLIGQTVNFSRAVSLNNAPPSSPSVNTFLLDNTNSNIRTLIENQPDFIGYELDVEINPLGNVSGNNDFYFTDRGMNAQLHIVMPLSFHADQLLLIDTLDLNFSTIENPEAIGSGVITIYADNSFPIAGSIQLYMLNDNGTVLDSLVVQPNQIPAGVTAVQNNALMSTGTVKTTLSIPLQDEKAQQLIACKRLLVKAKFDTGSNPIYVRLRSTDKLDINITADFNYTFYN
jgi:hypothetical protein